MEIKKGNSVSLDYEGKLDDGTVFDSSKHGDHTHPLEFKVGEGSVILGFEKNVIGLKVGEEKTFKIPAKDAYGEIQKSLIQKVPREAFPKDQKLEEGMVVILDTPTGEKLPLRVEKVEEKEVTLDLNHPLAGKDLTFNIKILEIK